MVDHIQIHDHERQLKRALRQLGRRGLKPKDTSAICRFVDQCAAEGLSAGRQLKYLRHLTKLASLQAMPFEDWARAEVTQAVGIIERSRYAAATKRDFRVALKRFYRWLRESDEEYPPEVRWIRTSESRRSRKLPSDLLSQEEVKQLIAAAVTARDKAFIFALYESGCRIGEIAGLRLRHVTFDEHGAKLHVHGKTGPRRVRLIGAVPSLAQWIDAHPHAQGPDSPLWVNLEGQRRGEAMTYSTFRAALKRATAKAGLKKRVHPHLLRHSRATHLANHLTEAQMKEHFGWTQGSDMAATYVHLSGRDVDKALLKLNGVEPTDEVSRPDTLRPTSCPRCQTANPATASYCGRCRMPLDLPTAMAAGTGHQAAWDAVMQQILQDPDVRSILLRKLRGAAAPQRR